MIGFITAVGYTLTLNYAYTLAIQHYLSLTHNLQFTVAVFFHHELPSQLSLAENLSGTSENYFELNCFENRTELSSYRLVLN
jgi:hypothetical protein